MEINIRFNTKIIEIWLTRAEAQDADLRAQLKPLYARYKAQGYLPAVFCSGPGELSAATSDLLCHNRDSCCI